MHSPIETIIVNAKVRTLDPGQPFAEAVAVLALIAAIAAWWH